MKIEINKDSKVQIINITLPNDKKYEFEGYEVKDLLKGFQIENYVEFSSNDGVVIALALDEIMEDKNVYLVTKENGKDILPKGSYRLVISSDEYCRRWTKGIVSVDLY
ncbi:hypothetical protein SAMN05216249_10151 [Acetitomaculum ruminis DSM 5522]|uniref:Oxidoreductase molybdopterin binding domain-containing protein n=1 Tax=Acetitomaculum ruminis DSM 5522 TaxID=1120918 RepID=A0A1I0UYK1_9FIRM|nr:hypothetical protein [Acetitomaculum ruminis]SFA69121.1 hypothetical protein SAMN05216249_10151 [Acetitomaculum ruminis DSM 5522]